MRSEEDPNSAFWPRIRRRRGAESQQLGELWRQQCSQGRGTSTEAEDIRACADDSMFQSRGRRFMDLGRLGNGVNLMDL